MPFNYSSLHKKLKIEKLPHYIDTKEKQTANMSLTSKQSIPLYREMNLQTK